MGSWRNLLRLAITPVGVVTVGAVVATLVFVIDPSLGHQLINRLVTAVSEIVFAILPLILVVSGIGFMVKKVFWR